MSDDRPTQPEPAAAPASPAPGPPADVRDRLRHIAARLRSAAADLGGEVMIDLPGRLGDHEGLLLALANELEQLVK
jgi:hypothetical protein